MSEAQNPAGWMYAEGDPPGTVRYWNGQAWQGDPRPVGPPPQAPQQPPAPSTGWSGTRKTVVAIAVVTLVIGGLWWWSANAGRAQLEAGEAFLEAVAEDDYDSAADLFAAECVADEPVDRGFLDREFRSFDIVDFELETSSVGITNGDQTGTLVGTAATADGLVFRVELLMLKRDRWLVCSYDFGAGTRR